MAAALSIKTISISGFRSFRQQDAIESFDPGHNALIGRNGSGKSNFFDAVQFVLLSPRFYNLRQEERQQRAPASVFTRARRRVASAPPPPFARARRHAPSIPPPGTVPALGCCTRARAPTP